MSPKNSSTAGSSLEASSPTVRNNQYENNYATANRRSLDTTEIEVSILSLAEAAGSDPRGRGPWYSLSVCPVTGDRHSNRDAVRINDERGCWVCFACGESGGYVDYARLTRVALPPREFNPPLHRSIWSRPPVRHTPKTTQEFSYPPVNQVHEVWNSARPVSDDARALRWLDVPGKRRIRPDRVELYDLCRVIPRWVQPPDWCFFGADPWSVTHPLIFRCYDSSGALRSLRARTFNPDLRAKSAAPKGYNVGGLVLANDCGQLLLQGMLDGAEWFCRKAVICEGDTDFLTAATSFSDSCTDIPAVFGIVAGSLTKALAERIATSCDRITIATDPDKAGDKYAADIERLLPHHIEIGRLRSGVANAA